MGCGVRLVSLTLFIVLVAASCAGQTTVAPLSKATDTATTPDTRAELATDVAAPAATETVVAPTVVAPTSTLKPPEPTVAPPTATPTRPAPTAVPPTATQAPAAPVILSFSADRTDIAERETVVLRWQGQGADSAAVWWFDARGLPASPVEVTGNPNNGSAVINPDASPIHLTLRNAAGEADAMVELDIHCIYAWIPGLEGNPNAERCPGEPVYTAAAQQPFENGFMVWLANEGLITVFYNGGHGPCLNGPCFRVFSDNFREGDPESDPAIIPPDGRYQPVRGFGLVWRSDAEVRDGLGWATAPEFGGDTWMQGFSGMGMHNTYNYLRDLNGRIIFMAYFDSSWQLYP